MTTITNAFSIASTKQEFAELLGMNYNAENDVMYKGNNNKTGLHIDYFQVGVPITISLYLNGNPVTGCNTSHFGAALKYERVGNDTCIFGTTADDICLNTFYSKYQNKDGTEGYCYGVPHISRIAIIVFDDEDTLCVTIPSISSSDQICNINGEVLGTGIIDAVSIEPLIIQLGNNQSNNFKKINNVYRTVTFPFSKREKYQEFILDNQRYIAMKDTTYTTDNYYPLVIKGNNS